VLLSNWPKGRVRICHGELGAPLLDQLEQSVDRAVRVLFETAPRSESGRSVEHPEVLMQD